MRHVNMVSSEALPMDDGRARFIVLALEDPHLLEWTKVSPAERRTQLAHPTSHHLTVLKCQQVMYTMSDLFQNASVEMSWLSR